MQSARTALLVIDMQNGFCHPDGAFARCGIDSRPLQAVVPNVANLIRHCRNLGYPIMWSLQQHLEGDVAGNNRLTPSHLKKEKCVAAPRGTWDAELVDAMKEVAESQDYFVPKHRFSMFYATTLDAILRSLEINHLVISGVTTNACVESTVREAYFRNYDVTVIEDCVAGLHPDLHAATLKNVRLLFGQVSTFDDFAAARAGA